MTGTPTPEVEHRLVVSMEFHTGRRMACSCGTPLGWFSRTGRKHHTNAAAAHREHLRLLTSLGRTGG